MPHQAPFFTGYAAAVAEQAIGIPAWRRALLRADAARRLGPRPVALFLAHRAGLALGLPQRLLRDSAPPKGPFLPARARSIPLANASRIVSAAEVIDPSPDWHGPFNPDASALSLTLHRGPGARAVWEPNRLAALPLLAAAARLDPTGPHLPRAEALLANWCIANPPYRGVNWACGQEAALRALHLCLALALLDADRDPPPGMRKLLEIHACRIAATPLYALAQDNNHPISEAAGAYALALILGRDPRRHAAALARRVARLVAPDGGFAQVSPGYTRLLLDTLSVAEWLGLRHGAPPFPAPLVDRAAAAARWLRRITCPVTGATPPLGLEDGSAFADLSLCGAGDARGSVERALRLFAGKRGDAAGDVGCALMALPPPQPSPASRERESTSPRGRGQGEGAARFETTAGTATWRTPTTLALLRTGPLRFRPGQSDLLHLSLRHRTEWLIRDGGTGSYDPPESWWWHALSGAAAHNAAVFDDADPMPRAGRFLLARWSRVTPLENGAVAHHRTGARHARRVTHAGDVWTIRDELAGRFRRVAFHWRLAPAEWRLTPCGATSPAATLTIIAPAPILRVEADAPVTAVTTRIHLPDEPPHAA
mgnify:CR=1 FL=1